MEGLVLSTGILLHLKYKYKVAEKTKATVFIHRAAIDYYYFCKYACVISMHSNVLSLVMQYPDICITENMYSPILALTLF